MTLSILIVICVVLAMLLPSVIFWMEDRRFDKVEYFVCTFFVHTDANGNGFHATFAGYDKNDIFFKGEKEYPDFPLEMCTRHERIKADSPMAAILKYQQTH